MILFTSCLSSLAESTPESSPVKLCSVKSLPGEKRFDFLHPGNIAKLISPPEKYPIIDGPQ